MPARGSNTKKRGPKKEKEDKGWKKTKKKVCFFCKDKIDYVDYKDTGLLRKFVSERGKIRRATSDGCLRPAPARRRGGGEERPGDGADAILDAMSTKVVLQKPVDKLGIPGDVVEVSDGYARNYLVPRGLAVQATKGMVRHQVSLKRAHDIRVVKEKGESEAVASKLAGTPIMVKARAGDEGKLFGSVTAENIADALRSQLDVDVDRRAVQLDEPIRSLGTHEARVRLFAEVEPIVHVEVVASE